MWGCSEVLSEASSCTGLAGSTSAGAVNWSTFLWPLHVAWASLLNGIWVLKASQGRPHCLYAQHGKTQHLSSVTFYWLEVSH